MPNANGASDTSKQILAEAELHQHRLPRPDPPEIEETRQRPEADLDLVGIVAGGDKGADVAAEAEHERIVPDRQQMPIGVFDMPGKIVATADVAEWEQWMVVPVHV